MSIFKLEIRTIKKGVIKWTIAIGVIIFMMLAFFPSMQTESMQSLAGAKMEGISPELLEALGISTMMDFTKITNFYGYVLQFITLALMVFVTIISISTLVKEETDGTIEFLYSKPVSRNMIFLQKSFANISSFIVLLFVLSVVTVIGYVSFSDYSLADSIKESSMFYSSILFVGLVFMSIGTLLSTVLRSNKGTSGIAMSIVFGTFILGMIGSIMDNLSFLTYISPMEWIQTQKLIEDGILITEWMIGFTTIIICYAMAYKIYNKKDLQS